MLLIQRVMDVIYVGSEEARECSVVMIIILRMRAGNPHGCPVGRAGGRLLLGLG